MTSTKAPDQWFAQAKRVYMEQHQGCAWCGGSHRVHAYEHGGSQVFHCQRCDFQVSFDSRTRRYQVIPGEELSVGMETMHEQPLANLL